jgi:hypothetical protein
MLMATFIFYGAGDLSRARGLICASRFSVGP